MQKLRVLIVDDSSVMRRLLSDTLSSEVDFEVSTAAGGKIALQKLVHAPPDVVIMDIEMPEMNGIEALVELRKTHPDLPVIMFSTLTERGAASTLDALAAGATDYAAKPSNTGDFEASKLRVRSELIPKIRAVVPRNLRPPSATPSTLTTSKLPPQRTPSAATGTPPGALASTGFFARPTLKTLAERRNRVDLVAIGSSTGGPNALEALISHFKRPLPVPIVLVQHMPALFTKLLAQRLDTRSPIRFHEAQAGMVLEPGHAYLAPGDYHMTLRSSGTQTVIELNQGPLENSCRPAVDPLIRSAVEIYGARVLGVVLTGMGQDGLRGCERLVGAGGSVIAQDEKTSVVWGMPGFVAKAGIAERILPLSEIGAEIERRLALHAPTASVR